MRVGRGAGVTDELSVAIGTTDSEVKVSQGVLLEAGASAGGEGATTGVVEGEGAVVGATASGVSELVAMGITLSEVMVSQGVDEGELDSAATEVGTTGAELEGRGAGLEG